MSDTRLLPWKVERKDSKGDRFEYEYKEIGSSDGGEILPLRGANLGA